MPLVFVYGPDTQQGRMYDRIGPSNMLTAAVLPGYRLVFNKPDRRNPKEGKANLVEAEDAQTFGLLFDLKDRQLEMLDGFFGGYQQQRVRPVPVGTESGRGAITWIARRTKDGLAPPEGHVALTLKGMEENEADEAFIEEVKAMQVEA